MDLLQVLVALVHIVLWSPQGNDVRLAAGIREGNLHLVELVPDLADVPALGPDQRPVEALLDQNVSRLLVFLARQAREEHKSVIGVDKIAFRGLQIQLSKHVIY